MVSKTDLRPGHRTILQVLYDMGKPLRASKIRDIGDISEGSFYHFLNPLMDDGLVEVGEVTFENSMKVQKYTLTDRGEQVTRYVLHRRPTELLARVEQLEDDVERIDGRFENLKLWVKNELSKHLGVEY